MLIKTKRRQFLGALGTATFAASTMRFFLKTAEAQEFPQRFVFLFTPNGQDLNAACTGMGADYTLGTDLSMFNEIKHKFTVLDGLQIPDHGGEEHPAGRCSMLTSWRSSGSQDTAGNRGQSIDIFLRERLTNGNSIYMGTDAPDDALDLPISWIGPNARNDTHLTGFDQAMGTLFRNAPVSMPAQDPAGMQAQLANEVALNDYLKQELDKLRAIAPASEVAKLDLHLQALNQIRADLAPGGNGSVTACNQDFVRAGSEADKMGAALAHALACGQTRIAIFRIGAYEPNHVHSHWQEGGMDGILGIREEFRKINREWATTILNFLKLLDSFPEGNGTLLDNTAVVWSSEVSNHYQSLEIPREYPGIWPEGAVNTHGTVDMPFFLAGSLGGKLKQGQRIVAQDRYAGELYKAIAYSMGVSMAELANYGEGKYASRILEEILV